jgi:uncharacterized protein YvpB
MNTINFLLEQETLPLVKEEIAFMKDTSGNKFHTLEKQLEKRNFIPIIDVIHEYFITNVNKNKEIYINYGPTITDKDGKIISIDDTISTNKSIITRRNVSSDMIIDNVYLDDIKDRLKQAKPKYVSQFSSEVDE